MQASSNLEQKCLAYMASSERHDLELELQQAEGQMVENHYYWWEAFQHEAENNLLELMVRQNRKFSHPSTNSADYP